MAMIIVGPDNNGGTRRSVAGWEETTRRSHPGELLRVDSVECQVWYIVIECRIATSSVVEWIPCCSFHLPVAASFRVSDVGCCVARLPQSGDAARPCCGLPEASTRV